MCVDIHVRLVPSNATVCQQQSSRKEGFEHASARNDGRVGIRHILQYNALLLDWNRASGRVGYCFKLNLAKGRQSKSFLRRMPGRMLKHNRIDMYPSVRFFRFRRGRTPGARCLLQYSSVGTISCFASEYEMTQAWRQLVCFQSVSVCCMAFLSSVTF